MLTRVQCAVQNPVITVPIKFGLCPATSRDFTEGKKLKIAFPLTATCFTAPLICFVRTATAIFGMMHVRDLVLAANFRVYGKPNFTLLPPISVADTVKDSDRLLSLSICLLSWRFRSGHHYSAVLSALVHLRRPSCVGKTVLYRAK